MQKYSNTRNAFRCQILVLLDYRFQFNNNILSEGLWSQILYQNLLNLSNYWSVKKSRGLFLFKRNEMKNGKGTLTSKMPFAARFSCCSTIDFNSILIYFPRGYDNKFYIKIFKIYPTIDLWKNRGGYFCLNEMRRKIARVL